MSGITNTDRTKSEKRRNQRRQAKQAEKDRLQAEKDCEREKKYYERKKKYLEEQDRILVLKLTPLEGDQRGYTNATCQRLTITGEKPVLVHTDCDVTFACLEGIKDMCNSMYSKLKIVEDDPKTLGCETEEALYFFLTWERALWTIYVNAANKLFTNYGAVLDELESKTGLGGIWNFAKPGVPVETSYVENFEIVRRRSF